MENAKVERYKHSIVSSDNLINLQIQKSEILNAIDTLELEVFRHWSITKLRFPQICILLGPIAVRVTGESEYMQCLHDLIAFLYVRDWNQIHSLK